MARCWESLKLLAGFAYLAFALTGPAKAEPDNTPDKTAPSKQKAGPTDLYGDPLPKGAIARLGTVRLHHPESFSPVLFSPDGNYLITASEFTTRKLQQGRMVHLWN